jgi:hypothetical protein
MAAGGVVFLFDENMPERLAAALREQLGESAFHVSDVPDAGTPDPAVIRHAGERGWCLLGSDRRMLRTPRERAVITELGVGAFFLNDTVSGFCTITRTVIRHWPEMKRIAAQEERPFLYLVKETTLSRLRRRHLGPPG